ncbi:hypothetical protein C5N14_19920 [Micromonospora sp. MW-13]|uniref:hypothetical protein n=1 Tax=Micromonospora sp. MW-13 TaxID=2094022 RepID=UPI000EF04B2C|nr:hypothetical protein [Micromonospora sp. MW-13]RGC67178.1 hypothetical protein C5N14_19920 [Micromonospora sp. MW-13]
MTSTVSRPGIGPLIFDRGPGALRVWAAQRPPHSSLYSEPVEVNILLDGTDDLDRADLPLIVEVLGRVDHYLEAGLRFVHRTLLSDPALFGLTEAELDSYRDFRVEEFPLASPELNFYLDEWHIRFADGRLPICHPYGLAVTFHRWTPVRVDDLSDSEEIG